MVDERTLDYYEEHAQSRFDRFVGLDRSRIHEQIKPYLIPGGRSADIGCGSGADLAWLNSIGCPAIGYEPTTSLRRLAQRRFVDLDIRSDFLPELMSIRDGLFMNVLCSAVLMHIPAGSLRVAIANLARILAPGGRLIASWRPSESGQLRERDGRLFSPIALEDFRKLGDAAGLEEIDQWTEEDSARPGLLWTTFVAAKR